MMKKENTFMATPRKQLKTICISLVLILLAAFFLALPQPVQAASTTLYSNYTYATRTAQVDGTFYSGSNESIRTNASPYRRVAVECNTSSIPDGSTINSITLHYNFLSAIGGGSHNISEYNSSTKPSSESNATTFYNACSGGTVYATQSYSPSGWRSASLGTDACDDMEANLANDWFAVGFAQTGTAENEMIRYTSGNCPYWVINYTYTPPGSLEEALDNSSLTWVTGGDAVWYQQSATTHDGTDAAQSGAVDHGRASYFRTVVKGTGTLTFWWSVSSELGFDYLSFYIDGVLQDQISDTSDPLVWAQKTYSISAGYHALKWEYCKDPADFGGSDCGWVDQVTFTGEGVTCGAVQIGTPDDYFGDVGWPLDIKYNYQRNQTIYLNSELGFSGTIAEIDYYIADLPLATTKDADQLNNTQVWLNDTSSSAFSGTSWDTPGTEVYNGNLTVTSGFGWKTIHFSSPFSHTDGNNLLVSIHSQDGTNEATSHTYYLNSTASYLFKAGSNNSVASPTMTKYLYRHNIVITYYTPSAPTVTFTNGANASLNYQQTSPSPPESNWHFGQFSLAGDDTGATLNSVSVMLGGTYDSGDLGSDPLPFRLYASATSSFGEALPIGSDEADPGSTHDVTFSSLNDTIPSGTRYYWVTADISGTATGDDNIDGTIDASGDLSITGGNLSGSLYGKLNAGSDATLPVELSVFTAQFLNGVPTLYWRTMSETDNIGWYVYRNKENDFDHTTRVNNDLIPGYGTTTVQHDYFYSDKELELISGNRYWYWLESIDLGGAFHRYDPQVLTIPDIPHPEPNQNIPKQYGLHQNKPNPLGMGKETTKISFLLPKTARAEIKIYNIRGELVKNLYKGVAYGDDEVSIPWDGRDENGIEQKTGIYLYQLKLNEKVYETKRLIVIR